MDDLTLELLSPAKNADIACVAIDSGADAVYMGGPGFGARREAGNSFADVERAASYAHRYGARLYLTLNTTLFDEELEAARKTAWDAYEVGVDALIVQDFGLLALDLPPIALHASTQCDIRTPEKALLLESLGFTQLVLARELSIEEVARVHERLSRARIECFVHGALCVCYSGRCYLSAALTGRSANRGACAQPCRLPYQVVDFAGKTLAKHVHALSLKDNDQSGNLSELVQAGARSFKIEGRLKDADYVKNITAYYRKRLDGLMLQSDFEDFRPRSLGRTEIGFEPDPQKTFHRSQTEYFAHGRRDQMASFDTPKSTGEPVGRVVDVNMNAGTLTVQTPQGVTLVNGDGLLYVDQSGVVQGLTANTVQALGNQYCIKPFKGLGLHARIALGTQVFRNHDQAFERELSAKNVSRRIPVDFCCTLESHGIQLKASCDAASVEERLLCALEQAKHPERTASELERQLSKTGETVFGFRSLLVKGDASLFVPASLLNGLRRTVLERLQTELCRRHRCEAPGQRVSKIDSVWVRAEDRINIANASAVRFWKGLGFEVSKTAFELGGTSTRDADFELMRTRYCLRHEMGLCPRQTEGDPEKKAAFKAGNLGHLKPEPLTLINTSGRALEARFDCRRCEMTIHIKA